MDHELSIFGFEPSEPLEEDFGGLGILRVFLPREARIDDLAETAAKALEEGQERRFERLAKSLKRQVGKQQAKDSSWVPPEAVMEVLEEADLEEGVGPGKNIDELLKQARRIELTVDDPTEQAKALRPVAVLLVEALEELSEKAPDYDPPDAAIEVIDKSGLSERLKFGSLDPGFSIFSEPVGVVGEDLGFEPELGVFAVPELESGRLAEGGWEPSPEELAEELADALSLETGFDVVASRDWYDGFPRMDLPSSVPVRRVIAVVEELGTTTPVFIAEDYLGTLLVGVTSSGAQLAALANKLPARDRIYQVVWSSA